mgnify:CR=1 FL=1
MDPYKVLGIAPGATDEEIKRAYRNLSRKYHPDANVNNPDRAQAEEKFKEVQMAYDQIMKKKGYSRFNVWWFNQIWKNELGIKKESTEYGCPLKYGHFGWYESIIPLIEDYCKKNTGRLK